MMAQHAYDVIVLGTNLHEITMSQSPNGEPIAQYSSKSSIFPLEILKEDFIFVMLECVNLGQF